MVRRPDNEYQPGDGGLGLPRQGYRETARLGPGVHSPYRSHPRRTLGDERGVPRCRPPALTGRNGQMRCLHWPISVIAGAPFAILLVAGFAASAPAFAEEHGEQAPAGGLTVSVSKSEVSTLTGATFTFT